MAKGKPKRKPFGMNSSLADATQVMRQLPVSAMLSSIEMQINILQERGVEIRDWENKDRVLKQVRILGGKAYFLAEDKTQGLERRKTMTPDSMANGVEEQKLLLKQYLGQYYYAKMKKKQLEARLRTFRENMLGTKGMQYSPVPRSQTNSVGDGPATQVIRAMEIEDRIESQKAEMAKTMLNVMKIMDFLPTDSTERSILEYRHIDCLSWKQVCKEANMTRTPCNKYYNAGIDKLLTYKKVQSILQEFASSQEPSKP